MDKQLYILTGASRGLGLAMAKALLRPGHRVLTLSRQPELALDALAAERGAELLQWSADLSKPEPVAARLRGWLSEQSPDSHASATLINNAALVTPPGPSEACDAQLLSDVLRVGFEAPLLLCAAFLAGTAAWPAPKLRRILNISSGLGRRAMAGQAPYNATKAGIDHYTRTLALDEALKPNGARVVALAPGVIDTQMQAQLRGGSAAGFPDRERFLALRSQGLLDSPEAAAAKVLAFLQRPDFGDMPVADVRDA